MVERPAVDTLSGRDGAGRSRHHENATGTSEEDWTDTMKAQAPSTMPARARTPDRVAVVGAGRMGNALARQRDAIAERLPQELELFDALCDATRRLAAADPVPA